MTSDNNNTDEGNTEVEMCSSCSDTILWIKIGRKKCILSWMHSLSVQYDCDCLSFNNKHQLVNYMYILAICCSVATYAELHGSTIVKHRNQSCRSDSGAWQWYPI